MIRDRRRAKWFWLDNRFMDEHAKAVGPIGVAVYCALTRYAGEDGRCFPAIKAIGEILGISESSVKRYLKVLADQGLIAIEARLTEKGDPDSSLYSLLSVEEDEEGVGSHRTQVGSQGPQGGFTQNPGVGSHRPTKKTHVEQDSVEEEVPPPLARVDDLPGADYEKATAWVREHEDLLNPLLPLELNESRLPLVEAIEFCFFSKVPLTEALLEQAEMDARHFTGRPRGTVPVKVFAVSLKKAVQVQLGIRDLEGKPKPSGKKPAFSYAEQAKQLAIEKGWTP